MNNNRIYAVDFVRSCSMLLIITYHVFTRMDWYKPDITHPFTNFVNGNWGYIGVACFFSISGFVLNYNYTDLTIQSGKRVLKNFYKKRWAGLFPAFYIVWIISYIVNIIKYNELWWGGGPSKIILSLLGFDGYFYYRNTTNYYLVGEWFLGAIIILYILYPFINTALLKKERNVIAFIICLSLIPMINLWRIEPFRNILSCIMPFTFGIWFQKNRDKMTKAYTMAISIALFITFYLVPLTLPNYLILNIMGCLLFTVMYSLGNVFMQNTQILQLFTIISSISYEAFLVHNRLNYKIITHQHFPVSRTEQYTYLAAIIFLSLGFGWCIKFIVSSGRRIKSRK